MSTWKEVDAPAKVVRPADQLDANPKPIADSAIVKIG